MSQTRNFDSSMLTAKKGTRAVYSNNLAQNTAVNAGTRLAVTGQSSTSNSFTIAIETGSTSLTPAEYNSIVGGNTPSGPPPPPPPPGPPAITFETDVNPLFQNRYTILPEYTSLAYTLIGGGGGGGGTAGGGGGAGGVVVGRYAVTAGLPISVVFNRPNGAAFPFAVGGMGAGSGVNGNNMELFYKNQTDNFYYRIALANGGIGGGAGIGGGGGNGNVPAGSNEVTIYTGSNGSSASAANNGNGGSLGGGFTNLYGGGGGGGSAMGTSGGIGFNGGTSAQSGDELGGNGGRPYYKLVIT